jgi:type I restriction enzyme S subunit
MSFKEYTIEECCDILNNLRFPLNSEQRFDMQGEFAYYGANGVQGYINQWRFDDDLILIAEDGGNFEQYATRPIAYRVSGKCWVNNHAHVLKAKDKYSQNFIFYSLQHKNILYFIAGGTRSKLTQGELKKIIINHPKKDEADKIAQILSKADTAIAQTEALIAKYQRIKTGLMQDLLTKGIDEHGNIRSKDTHRFVVKNGIEVPEEWEVSKIGTYLDGIEQGWSPDCEGEPAPTGEWGVLKTTSVTWDGYNENENKKLPEKLFPKTQYEIKNGDVLITRGGPNSRVGVVVFVEKTRNNLILCDKIYRLKTKASLLPEFLAIALSSSTTQTHLSNLKTGMAESQTNISQKIVEALTILIPNPNEQKIIIERLRSVDKILKQNKINLRKLQSFKTGLMQDLLSGKVRVKIKEELAL